jgi:ferredoxin-NADP reductase
VIEAHADRTAQDHALRQTVQRMGHQLDNFISYTWYEHLDPGDTTSRQGHMDLSDIPLPDDLHVFTCGPLAFMRHIRTELMQRGVPAHTSATRCSARISGPPRETAFEPSGEYLGEWLARAPDRLPAGAARSLYDTLAHRTSFVVYRR